MGRAHAVGRGDGGGGIGVMCGGGVGRTLAVGRDLGVGVILGEKVGVGVGVGVVVGLIVAVPVGLGVTVVIGVDVAVTVGVGLTVAVGVDEGEGPDEAQYLPPLLKLVVSFVPPQTIISLPDQIAV